MAPRRDLAAVVDHDRRYRAQDVYGPEDADLATGLPVPPLPQHTASRGRDIFTPTRWAGQVNPPPLPLHRWVTSAPAWLAAVAARLGH